MGIMLTPILGVNNPQFMVTGSDVGLQGFGKIEGALMITGIDLK